jgi:hypothetical protein
MANRAPAVLSASTSRAWWTKNRSCGNARFGFPISAYARPA